MTNASPRLTGARCQCTACGEFFNSTSTFDRHRVGTYGNPAQPRRCLRVDEMAAKGFAKNDQGFWLRHRRKAGTIRRERARKGRGGTTVAVRRSGQPFRVAVPRAA